MVLSMTGFGQVKRVVGETKLNVEIKTVNHRFLDLSLNMSTLFNPYEEQIKAVIRSHFKRGRIELYISSEGKSLENQTIMINWALLDQYHQVIESIETTYPETSHLLTKGLPEFTDVLQVTKEEQKNNLLFDEIIEMVKEACTQVKQMRLIEGKKLAKDIHSRVEQIKELVDKLAALRLDIKDKHYQRMVERLNDLLAKQGLSQDERFYHELAIIAEKGDLTEELIRIDSHTNQIESSLKADGEIGRNLDFICQELIREANTIGSKANDPIISEYVIELKATIEKVKEQVQNIE
ncbi:YicC/YloC family endoribonuclease [Amphibacillus sp. Q70]|uniref:YicC/YloC family endoribonuclease n=1 Tax=Amphibacillus sp. Q70 TaxID=3453416 RepID=UPI003F82D74E